MDGMKVGIGDCAPGGTFTRSTGSIDGTTPISQPVTESTDPTMIHNTGDCAGDMVGKPPITATEPEPSAANFQSQMLSLTEILTTFGSALGENRLWAVCWAVAQHLSATKGYAQGNQPIVTPWQLHVHANGSVSFHGNGGDQGMRFLPDQTEDGPDCLEKCVVFSLGATLFSAADYALGADEEPSLSTRFEALLAGMTQETASERYSLEKVVQVCEDYKQTVVYQHELLSLFNLAMTMKTDLKKPIAEIESKAVMRNNDAMKMTLEAIKSGVTLREVTVEDILENPPYISEETLHSLLMDGVRAKPRLSNVYDRELGAPLDAYVTPWENLMDQIREPPFQLAHVEPLEPKSARIQLSTPRPGGSLTPGSKRRELAVVGLNDILGGWNVDTQVELGFAAEAAAQADDSTIGDDDDTDDDEEEDDNNMFRSSGDTNITDEISHISESHEEPVMSARSSTDSPVTYLRFSDFSHIRKTLVKVDLENLHDDKPELFQKVKAGKVCASCRAQKATLLSRLRQCCVCECHSCHACISKIMLPSYMFSKNGKDKQNKGADTTRRPRSITPELDTSKPVLICTGCRAALGGVSLE